MTGTSSASSRANCSMVAGSRWAKMASTCPEDRRPAAQAAAVTGRRVRVRAVAVVRAAVRRGRWAWWRSQAVREVAASRSHSFAVSNAPRAAVILASSRSASARTARMAGPSTGTCTSSTANANDSNM